MCGIVGFLSYNPGIKIDKTRLIIMTDKIAHRGPDDFGYALFNRNVKNVVEFRSVE